MPAEALRDVEARLYGVLRWPCRGCSASTSEVSPTSPPRQKSGSCFICCQAAPTTWLMFVMESAGRFVTVAFKFIPIPVRH